jgi:hypothetical protein
VLDSLEPEICEANLDAACHHCSVFLVTQNIQLGLFALPMNMAIATQSEYQDRWGVDGLYRLVMSF